MNKPNLFNNDNAKLIRIDKEHVAPIFSRVLLVDDDPAYREIVTRNLHEIGFQTTVADSVNTARLKLSERQYPVVFCDDKFDDSGTLGSEFIIDEQHLFKDSQVVLVTGWAVNQIKSRDLLKEQGVEILEKGAGTIERMKFICRMAVDVRVNDFENKIERLCSTLLSDAELDANITNLVPDVHLLRKSRTYLRNYFKSLPDQDIGQFYIDGKSYSPAELISEVENSSAIGDLLVEMLLDDIFELQGGEE